MANMSVPILARIEKRENILPYIASGKLTYPSYIFCADTETLVFVDKDLEMKDIKGYGSSGDGSSITKLSQLENDVGYLTDANFQAITKDAIENLFDN